MVDDSAHFRGESGLSLARRTLELFERHNVPSSPANYEIWITHVAGLNPALSRELQQHLESAPDFPDAVGKTLFERFFANTRLTAEMVQTSESIARELSGVISSLRDAGARTDAYVDTLESAVTSLESGHEPADLGAILGSLTAATRTVIENNRLLSQQMESSSQQVETLQTALQAVKVEALTDGLTGLANRRFFDEVLHKHLSTPTEGDLCLLMCDIDHFKRFNDTWGHLVGDQVIRFISSVLSQHTPPEGTAARYGGEEFAIVLPGANLVAAMSVATAVHHAVRTRKLSRRSTGEVIGAVTISIGVAQHRPGESANDFIGRADACLYASKRAGRDRITGDAASKQASAA
jgi:diguanylate cyclase